MLMHRGAVRWMRGVGGSGTPEPRPDVGRGLQRYCNLREKTNFLDIFTDNHYIFVKSKNRCYEIYYDCCDVCCPGCFGDVVDVACRT